MDPLPSSKNLDTLVAQYTEFFFELSGSDALFSKFRSSLPERTPVESKVVGSLWYHLSDAIVDILCIALANIKNTRIRHLVIQTAYEELGESSIDKVHTLLLRDTLAHAGVTTTDILRWSGHEGVNRALGALLDDLRSCTDDAEICGLLLGIEIIAYPNVDNVVDYLSHSEEVAAAVRASEWVRLHHEIDEAHIYRAVRVYVEHMPDLASQRRCVAAFMRAIRFWEEFWEEIATTTRAVRAARAALA